MEEVPAAGPCTHTRVALQALPPACRAGLDAPPLLDRCGAREVRRVRAALRIRRDGSSTREGSCQRGTSRALHAAAVDRRAALIQGCPWRGSGCGHMRTGGEEGIALQGVVQEIMRLRTPTAAGGREPERQARTFLSPQDKPQGTRQGHAQEGRSTLTALLRALLARWQQSPHEYLQSALLTSS